MVTKVFVFLVFVSSLALADVRNEYKQVHRGLQMDLLREGSTLKLKQEQTVQEYVPPSSMFLSVLAGGVQPTSLSVESHNQSVNYNFSHLVPLASVQVNHYFIRGTGQWGWAASVGYSYSQYDGLNQTALHLIPVDVDLAYRLETRDTQKVVPYLMAGPQLWTYFQRGVDQYNTSQSSLFGCATAGLAFNLNRFHVLTSRNETELVLQYRRTIGSPGGSTNFNGDTVQLGGTIAL